MNHSSTLSNPERIQCGRRHTYSSLLDSLRIEEELRVDEEDDQAGTLLLVRLVEARETDAALLGPTLPCHPGTRNLLVAVADRSSALQAHDFLQYKPNWAHQWAYHAQTHLCKRGFRPSRCRWRP